MLGADEEKEDGEREEEEEEEEAKKSKRRRRRRGGRWLDEGAGSVPAHSLTTSSFSLSCFTTAHTTRLHGEKQQDRRGSDGRT